MLRTIIFLLSIFSSGAYATEVFQEKHLGYKFALGENIVYAHNPHSMRKTKIFHDGKHIGGFTISVLPDNVKEEEFVDYGERYYRRKHPDAIVEIHRKVNSKKFDYNDVIAIYSASGMNFIEKRIIFIQERDGVPGEEMIPMTYTFNFLYLASTPEVVVDSIHKMVDTFELIPNDGTYNYAIKNVVQQ